MTKLIYIGCKEGKHEGVMSEKEQPEDYQRFLSDHRYELEEQLSSDKDDCYDYQEYLESLPRHILSPELVEGLNPGDEVTKPYREQKQVYDKFCEKWISVTDGGYKMQPSNNRRIILVPANPDLKKLDKEIDKMLDSETPESLKEWADNNSVPAKEEQLMYEQDLPENMSQEDYDKWYAQSKLVDSVRMGPVSNPQSQGEDELWYEVGKIIMDGYESSNQKEVTSLLKSKYTITPKPPNYGTT